MNDSGSLSITFAASHKWIYLLTETDRVHQLLQAALTQTYGSRFQND